MKKNPFPHKAAADETDPPLPARAKRESPSPATGEGLRVVPGKNRLTQVSRAGSRKLFDAGRRELFLEWFAATCNVKLSAEKAGVCYQTVFKHRMKDEAFADAWDRALQQGYAYLEARLLQEAFPAMGPLHHPSDGPPTRSGEDLQAEAEKHFDPELAITLLREHARRLPGSADKRKHQRHAVRVASNAEVKAELTKRLKAFSVRRGGPHPARATRESPSPPRGEGQE